MIESIPDYGDLILYEEFLQGVGAACFIDYDGHGYWSDGRVMDSSVVVKPSEIDSLERPSWASHIMWFNR